LFAYIIYRLRKEEKEEEKQCVLKPRFTVCNVFNKALKDSTRKEDDTSCSRSAGKFT